MVIAERVASARTSSTARRSHRRRAGPSRRSTPPRAASWPRWPSARRRTSTEPSRPVGERSTTAAGRSWAPASGRGGCAGGRADPRACGPDRRDRVARHRQAAGQATAEVHLGADFFIYFAGHAELPDGRTYPVDAGYFVYSEREPYGVVGAISPWNYPFLLACWKTAPALAVGNSVVLKMAEQTPLSTSTLGPSDAGGGHAGWGVQHGPR